MANPEDSEAPELEEIVRFLAEGQAVCRSHGRKDLEAILRNAAVRLSRPATVLCMLGDYKQGKSSLVNALVGEGVSPVDDDLATTAITIVHHREPPRVQVTRRHETGTVVEPVEPGDLWRWVSEQGNPGNERGVTYAEVGVSSPLTSSGVTLVDTPGAGGLLTSQAPLVLEWLPLADAVLFVSDASAELSAPELSFLQRAAARCPLVVVVVTKIDIHVDWRRIADLDRSHLRDAGIDAALVPVSSVLHAAAEERGDSMLDDESGLPRLLETIRDDVVARVSASGGLRACRELLGAVESLTNGAGARLSALEDPRHGERLLRDLGAAQERLQAMEAAGARWSVALAEGFADLQSDVDYRLRTSLASLVHEVDEHVAEIDPGPGWQQYSSWLQARVAEEAGALFSRIDDGVASVRDRIAGLVGAELSELSELVPAGPPDVEAVWERGEHEPGIDSPGLVATGLTAARGGTSGIILLGVIGQLAGLAMVTPVALGVGVAFGAKQVLDLRKRARGQRRAAARRVAREFVGQVQLELSHATRRSLMDAQRELRDAFSSHIRDVTATCRATVKALRADAARATQAREQEIAALRAAVDGLADLESRIRELVQAFATQGLATQGVATEGLTHARGDRA